MDTKILNDNVKFPSDKFENLSDWWYKMCKRHKWCNWIDDNIIWYIWDKPKSCYKSIKHWFICNWNIHYYRLLKQAFKTYPWDGSFIYELEEKQIDCQIHWFKHHQLMIDEQYNEIMRSLRWAKHCIHTINNEIDLFHYDGDCKFIPLVKDENGKHVDAEDLNTEAELYRLDNSGSVYCYDGPKLNRRNARRFLNKHMLESDMWKEGKCDHELYMAKAKHLYHLIRLRYTDLWWD